MTEDVLPVADRLAIHELLALHGHLIDHGDVAGLSALFTPDAVYDVTATGFRGLDKLRELSIGGWNLRQRRVF